MKPRYEDDPQAILPEPGSPPPRPQSYFAPASPFGRLVISDSRWGRDRQASPWKAADRWLEAKYRQSHWRKSNAQ